MILAPTAGLLGGVFEMPLPHTVIQEHFPHRLSLYLVGNSSWHMEGWGQNSDQLWLDGTCDFSNVLSPSTVKVAAAAAMVSWHAFVPTVYLCQLRQKQKPASGYTYTHALSLSVETHTHPMEKVSQGASVTMRGYLFACVFKD